MRNRPTSKLSLSLTLLAILALLCLGCGDESSLSEEGGDNGDIALSDSNGGGDSDAESGEEGDTGPPLLLAENPEWLEINLGEETIWRSISSFEKEDESRSYLLTGDNGVVAILDGFDTTYYNLGITESIRAAWADKEGTLIVAGDNGFVRHWNENDQEWKLPSGLPLAGLKKFSAIAGNHPSNIYIGGDNGQFFKWNGADWLNVTGSDGAPVTSEDINGLWMADDGIVFAAAGAQLIWGKGIEWQYATTEKEMRTVFGFSSQNVFAGGGFGNCPQPPCTKYIYNFTVAGWQAQTTPAPAAQGINSIWGSDEETVLAISFKGTVLGYSESSSQSGWELLTQDSAMYDYVPHSHHTTPKEEEIQTQTLTLDRIHGIGIEDVLIAARKQITPPGETISETPGCDGCSCEICVCAEEAGCCVSAWADSCVTTCKTLCGGDASGGEKGLLLRYTRHPLEEEAE